MNCAAGCGIASAAADAFGFVQTLTDGRLARRTAVTNGRPKPGDDTTLFLNGSSVRLTCCRSAASDAQRCSIQLATPRAARRLQRLVRQPARMVQYARDVHHRAGARRRRPLARRSARASWRAVLWDRPG